MANNDETGGSGGRGSRTTRPLNFTIEEAEVLANNSILVPPGWRLPSGWQVSASGYVVAPFPATGTAEYARMVQNRWEALTSEERALSENDMRSPFWYSRISHERQHEVDTYLPGVPRYNSAGRTRRWKGRDVDAVLAQYGYEPQVCRRLSRRGRSAPTASMTMSRSGSSDGRSAARSAPYQPPRRSTDIVLRDDGDSAPPRAPRVKLAEDAWEDPPPEAMVEGDTRPWWLQEACELDRAGRHPDDPAELPGLALALAHSRADSGGAAAGGSGGASTSGAAAGGSGGVDVVNLVSDNDEEEEEDVKPLIRRRVYGGGRHF